MEAMQLIWTINIAILGIGVFLHATGMTAIYLSRIKLNQTVILLNLSIADMCALLHGISVYIYKYATYDPHMFEDQKKMFNVLSQIQWWFSDCGAQTKIVLRGALEWQELHSNCPP